MAVSSLELGVRGVDGAIANLFEYDRVCQRRIRATVRKYGKKLQRRTQELVPVDTGFLRDHVLCEFTPDDLIFDVGWDATDFFAMGFDFYAFFVEYGTSRMPARPSLTQASRELLPAFSEAISDAVRTAIHALSTIDTAGAEGG